MISIAISKRIIMKTKNKIYLLAVSAAALSLSASTSFGQLFSPADAQNNRAIAASPRALEQFPWLSRQSAKPTARVTESRTVLTEVKKNRALAASPRMLEQFPELGRSAQPFQKSAESSVVSTVTKNRAYAASPRAIEQFPWLARQSAEKTAEKPFQVAPIK